MRFEWDEKKRRENLRKHRLDFRDAPEVFLGETATNVDERYDYGETRYYTLGMLQGVVVAISHTEKDDLVRIISFRSAERHEQEIYFKTVRD